MKSISLRKARRKEGGFLISKAGYVIYLHGGSGMSLWPPASMPVGNKLHIILSRCGSQGHSVKSLGNLTDPAVHLGHLRR